MISIRSSILPLAVLLGGSLSSVATSLAAVATVSTAPVGVVTIRAGGGTAALAVPLEPAPAYVGVVAGASKRSIVAKKADWKAASAGDLARKPLVVRMTSGRGDGRTFLVASIGKTKLGLATTEDLSTIISAGNRFEILPADTLASLFGADGSGLTTNANPDLADNVRLLEDGKWQTYFHDGRQWLQTGDAAQASRNFTPVAPGQGFVLVRRTTIPFALVVTGNVPDDDATFSAAAGVSRALVGSPFPTNRRLAAIVNALELERGRGWQTVSVRTAAGWNSYSLRGPKLTADNGQTSKTGPVVAAGSALLLERNTTAQNP